MNSHSPTRDTPLTGVLVWIQIPAGNSPGDSGRRLIWPENNYVGACLASNLIAAKLHAAGCQVKGCHQGGPLEDCLILLEAAPLNLVLSTIAATMPAVLLGGFYRIAWRDPAEMIWRTGTGDEAPEINDTSVMDKIRRDDLRFTALLKQLGIKPPLPPE